MFVIIISILRYMSKNEEKSITRNDLRTELSQFTEDVLLPAIENIVDDKLETKLEEKLESKLDDKLESKLEEKLESKLEEKLESKLNEKFDEKLAPIFLELARIRDDIDKIKAKLERMEKMFNEDTFAVSNEVEKLKKRVSILETELKLYRPQIV